MRGWFRKVWNVRGGGLYAVGYIVSFLWFEIGSLAGDIAGVFELGNGHIIQFIVGIVVDSFRNMALAFMWPYYIVQWSPVYGGIALGVAFALFPRYLKKPIERYLFDGEPETEAPKKA